MTPTPNNPHNSAKKARNKGKSWTKKQCLGLTLSVGLGSSAIALGCLVYKLESSLPDSIDNVRSYARPKTLTIKAQDGTVLKEIGEATHEKIKLEAIPETIHQAFVASEDKRFYQHNGVDLRGITRAAVANLKAGKIVEGASTITQQLARIAFLNQERKIWRKLKEMTIATAMENSLDKSEILETYLNLVYLGSGAYGIADASWVYFGKSPQELTIAEAATLAGIVPAPSVYSPINNLERATKQRNVVLSKMEREGFISPTEAETAKNSPLITRYHRPKRLSRRASYFTNYIETELPKYVDPKVLAAGGIVVETTLKPEWQQAAESTVNYSLDRYGKWMNFQQAAMVALDPRTGEINAMVGGRDFGDNQYNRVTQAQRQPGSTFKTFVYTTAIAAGFSPYKSYLDAEYFVDGYQPKNYKKKYRNVNVSIYDALVSSINTIALRTTIDVGWNPIIEISQKMGIKSPLNPTYSLALGASEVNLLELTNAYGTLANKGVFQEAHGISRIRDRQGNIIYEANFTPQKAVNQATAAMMNWMLQGVVQAGTGIPAQIGRPVAGKTGTSDESRDLWFIGYIPQLAAGVWLGNDDNKPTTGTSGIAAEMWRNFMLKAVKGMPIETFPSRPPLTGREAIIVAEPIEPKRSYYKKKAQTAPVYQNTRSLPSRHTPPKAIAKPEPEAAPAPQPTPTPTPAPKPTPAPVATPTPVPVKPKFSKIRNRHIPASHPINDPNRDWVKERLGR